MLYSDFQSLAFVTGYISVLLRIKRKYKTSYAWMGATAAILFSAGSLYGYNLTQAFSAASMTLFCMLYIFGSNRK